jgi:hypothetical protein
MFKVEMMARCLIINFLHTDGGAIMVVLRIWFFLFATLLVSGCGDSKVVKVEGKLSQGGMPIELKKSAVIQIVFYPDSADEKNVTSFPADFDRESFTYKIAAVPVGKYKVSVVLLDPYPNNDKLKGAYSSKRTPLSCNLQGNTVFDIDITMSKK